MIQIEHPYYLYGLLAIPVFILLFWFMRFREKQLIAKLGDATLIGRLMPERSSARGLFKFILLMFAYIFLVIAIANPQIGARLERVKRKGISIALAIDVSNSMLAQDIKPNRMQYTKFALSNLVKKLENNKLGIIVFAGRAYTQLPVTTDISAIDMFAAEINPGIVPVQGTAIGAAIEQSMQALELEKDKSQKVIIVISDGENHEDDAVGAARMAHEKGMVVHTIGMGTPEGAPIPVGRNIFKTDAAGQTVVTRLNEAMLQEIAQAGHGVYIRASNNFNALNLLYKEIEKAEKKEIDSKQFSEYESRYSVFIGLSLLCLFIEFLLSERRSRWAGKINLFKE